MRLATHKAVAGIVVIVGAIVVIVGAIAALANYALPFDDTDPPDGRSGLMPHTDALTGCQYLAVRGGGITPRPDSNGKHICKGESK